MAEGVRGAQKRAQGECCRPGDDSCQAAASVSENGPVAATGVVVEARSGGR